MSDVFDMQVAGLIQRSGYVALHSNLAGQPHSEHKLMAKGPSPTVGRMPTVGFSVIRARLWPPIA